jgi:glycerol transport system ATP-binding protein
MRKRVHEIAEILELTTDLPRRANGLSADAKQKISLGRGLVRPDVAAVLFDEPLTVIDPHVKWLLRRKLKQIHQQLKLSLIYVTHDQTEALTFADQVVVMTEGEIVQTGTPEQLFETPEHRFVGHFIGSPGMNFIDCTWQGSSALVHGTPVTTSSTTIPPPAASLTLGIRPEYVELCDSNGPNRLPAQITAVHDRGTYLMARVVVGDHPLWGKVHDVRRAPQLGEAIVHLPADKCALYADDRRLA